MFKFINMDAHADENRIFCIDESALLHSSFVFQNHKTGCHVAKVFQMKSVTLQVVLKEGCRVCILLLSAFALLHSSFVLLNYKVGCYVAKVFQMKSATLQAVLDEGCRFCILLWVPLHCCILLLSC